MNTVLNIYKPIGDTPLETINQLKKRYTELKDLSITYAGRLDPLAHGVLILVIDEAIAEKSKYMDLPKIYEFEALLGISTDTFDVLGIIDQQKPSLAINNVNAIVNSFVNISLNKTKQPYPPFSSKTVAGKPLFQWAKENRLNEIQIPEREIAISSFKMIESKAIFKQDLEKKVYRHISLVKGDFRQTEIKKSWEKFFTKTQQQNFQIIKFEIQCSSGTYIRGLVHELGQQLGCGAVALDIYRTAVGDFTVSESQVLS